MKLLAAIATVLILAAAASADLDNWNGSLDTATISDTLETDTIKYSRALQLTDGEDIRAVIKFNDTTSAGFSGDSIRCIIGYQTGSIVRDSAGTRDTLWDERIVLDTLHDDSLGKSGTGYVTSAGDLTRYWLKRADTTQVTGWAVMSRWFVPEWNELIRYYAKGMADNNPQGILIQIETHRRLYVPTRGY